MKPATDFDTYQNETGRTAIYPGADDPRSPVGLSYVALGLAGEAGEVADRVKKVIRDSNGVMNDQTRLMLAQELGDVLWYVARLATHIDWSLQAVAGRNIAKLRDRQRRGKLSGSGDNR